MKKLYISLFIFMLLSSFAFAGGEGEKASYPSRTFQVVVPYSAGGGSDTYARTIERYIDMNGQPYVVTNIAGGGGSLGTMEVLNSKADGYTILFHSITSLVGSYYAGNFDYKVFEKFEPVASVFAMYYGICTKADAPYQSVDELVEYAKAHPGELSIGVAGFGGAAHIVGLNFADAAGIELQFVPYAGASDVKAALEGGHADIAVLGTSESFDFIKAGRFIQLAHSGPRPIDTVDAPTFRECGIDFTFTHRNGYVFPKGTPQEAIDYMVNAIKEVAETPEFIETIESRAAFVDFLGPEEFQDYLYELDIMIEPYAELMK